MTAPAVAEETVQLYAAGSLKAALTEVAKAYRSRSGNKVEAQIRTVRPAEERDLRGRQGRCVCLRQHGASAGAARRKEERPGGAASRATSCARW